jgi:arylsulfatase A-like enzyme
VLVGLAAGVCLWLLRTRRPTAPTVTAPAWVGRISDQTRASRPNILLVVYDARRRDDFSFGRFGNARADTPFLAKLAEDAIFFDDAVSPGCWTVPVHASIFSGLSVCELGDDYYNPGVHSFPDRFLSLAEVLRLAGYRTAAYADHPYFLSRDRRLSLIRGFDLYDVITDFERYPSFTNVGTPQGEGAERYQLEGLAIPTEQEVAERVARFNRGELELAGVDGAGYDADNGIYLAPLFPLFARSDYFRRRWGDAFDQVVFADPEKSPYFLFLNLHMSTLALPDPGLYLRWRVETLLLNAQKRGASLGSRRDGEGLEEWLARLYAALHVSHAPFRTLPHYLKQAFDNRFYDAGFRAVYEYLEKRGLLENTVTIVTSDHGLSFGEHGERLYLHAGARPYEYMTRVPLVLRFPAGSRGAMLNGRYAERVSLIDLFRTVVDLAIGPGVFERDLPVRGHSLLERLERKAFDDVQVSEASLTPDTYTLLPSTAAYSKAVYAGDLKLVLAPQPMRMADNVWPIHARLDATWPGLEGHAVYERLPRPLVQLFDLAGDPHERHDLAGERPADVARLKDLAGDTWECRPYPWQAARAEWDEKSLETLRSLGYIHD